MIAQLSTAALLLAGSAAAAPSLAKRAGGQKIQIGDSNKCIALSGVPKNGATLTQWDCDKIVGGTTKFYDPNSPQSYYGLWDISRGDQQSVKLTNTNFCLDVGNGNDDIVGKIWECFPGAPQQRWFYTDDNHIAVTGGSKCVTGGDGVTFKGCGGNDQAFKIHDATWSVGDNNNGGGETKPPPTGELGRRIRLGNDGLKCLTVGGKIENGAPLITEPCDAAKNANQVWYIQRGQDAIRLVNTDFCVDYGLNPGNGVGGKIWKCYNGSPQQANYYTDDDHLALAGGSVCLDAKAGSNQVQQWQCIGGNTNQIWTS